MTKSKRAKRQPKLADLAKTVLDRMSNAPLFELAEVFQACRDHQFFKKMDRLSKALKGGL